MSLHSYHRGVITSNAQSDILAFAEDSRYEERANPMPLRLSHRNSKTMNQAPLSRVAALQVVNNAIAIQTQMTMPVAELARQNELQAMTHE